VTLSKNYPFISYIYCPLQILSDAYATRRSRFFYNDHHDYAKYTYLPHYSDAGALLLAFTHPDANLLGVNVNYPSTYSALAVSALLGYYNHSDVPLGLIRPYTNITWLDDFAYENGEYASKVAYHWREFSPLPWGDVRGT
jgi:hypothetical protein